MVNPKRIRITQSNAEELHRACFHWKYLFSYFFTKSLTICMVSFSTLPLTQFEFDINNTFTTKSTDKGKEIHNVFFFVKYNITVSILMALMRLLKVNVKKPVDFP